MADSFVTYAGNGSQTAFALPFPYLDAADVNVYVNDVAAPFTFINPSAVNITTPPPAASSVRLQRITLSTSGAVDFVDGSNLLERDLDLITLRSVYLGQESADVSGTALRLNHLTQYDAHSRKIVNLAAGAVPTDGVNKGQMDALVDTSIGASSSLAAAAAGSAGAAAGSAGAAAGSAGAAAGSAGASNTSALASEASRQAVDNRNYPGVYAVAPVLRPNGTAIQAGDSHLRTDGYQYSYIGGVWVNQTAAAAASAAAAAASAADALAAKLLTLSAQAATELARDTALAAALIYSTTAAGITATNGTANKFFYVPSVNADESLVLYLNVTGTATEQKRYPSINAVSGVRAKVLEQAVRSALAGGNGVLKALFHQDGPKTYASSSARTMNTWVSADDSALTASLYATLYNGTDPRPIEADRGIYFNSQAGLTVSSGILAKTSNFGLFHAFDLNFTYTTYATKAAADAAVGSHVEGDVVKVTADTNTVYTPDVSLVMESGLVDNQLVNGYYIRNNGSWASLATQELWAFAGTGGIQFRASISRLGQLIIFAYDGAAQAQVRSIGTDLLAYGGKQIASLFRDGTHLRLLLNGREIMAIKSSVNITTMTTFYFNGDSRIANNIIPVNGIRQYVKAFCVVDDCTWTGFTKVHDAISAYAGTTLLELPPEAWGIDSTGQSWQDGAIDPSSDTWTTAGGWNGKITRENATYSGDQLCVSRDSIPHVYCSQQQTANNDIGPMNIDLNGLGNVNAANSHKPASGSGETWEFSATKHLTGYPNIPKVDWIISAAGAGGFSLANLTLETTPNILVQAIKSKPTVPLTTYERLVQGIVNARDFARSRGQRFVSKLWFWQQGHTDLSNANYVADFLAHYDKVNAMHKRITGQADDVICLMPQINWSSDGVRNSANSVAGVVDQKILDIIDARGTRPIYCTGPIYPITNFIHPYRAGHRWYGEYFGKVAKRIIVDGNDWQPLRPSALTRGTNYVDIDFYVPSGAIQFATNANNIASTVQIDGVNTYGFEGHGANATVTVSIASPGVVTWNAHGRSNGDRIRMTTGGALPTGLTANTDYYVVNAAANTFQLSLTNGGAAIDTTGTQSGSHIAYNVSNRITAVAITGAARVRVTFAGNLAAGDTIRYAGLYSRVGNFCDSDPEVAYYRDQDWTVPLVSGAPAFKQGSLYDLKNWCCAFTKVLT